MALASSGKLRPLAVMASKRLTALPNVPTMAESGYPGLEVRGWTGVMAPANLLASILSKLAQGTEHVKGTTEFKTRMEAMGFPMTPTSPQAFGDGIRVERDFWKAKISEIKIALQ